jgi:hypothetical protein
MPGERLRQYKQITSHQWYWYFVSPSELSWSYGSCCHFQQYFSYIMAVSLLMEETGVPGENHWPVASQRLRQYKQITSHQWYWYFVSPSELSWSYGSSIYNYVCNQCLSLLKLCVRIPLRRGITILTEDLWNGVQMTIIYITILTEDLLNGIHMTIIYITILTENLLNGVRMSWFEW